MEKKTLYLTLTKKWFDMVKSGKKREEYREIKQYWTARICKRNEHGRYEIQHFDYVEFRHGYKGTEPPLRYRVTDITIGKGNPSLGAPVDKRVFIIKFQ